MRSPGSITRREALLLATAAAASLSACGRRREADTVPTADLTELGAAQAVAAMQRGEFSAESYAEALLRRYEQTLRLNAFISMDAERVLQAARAADLRLAAGEPPGLLHGLPIPVKDSVNTKDYPTTGGTPALMHFYPPDDADLVKALQAAGAIVMGKTNIHELSFGWTSNNYNTGAVRNPYGLDRIPGGSSGGSAAAVAARVAPIAIAEDTEGSIRVPAALCGVHGFRPTLHRYPNGGVMPLQPLFDQVGPLARSMDDLMLFDRAISGDATPFEDRPLDGVRLGVDRQYYYGGLDTDVERLTNSTLRKLSDAGAVLVEAEVPKLADLIGRTTYQCQSISVIAALEQYLETYQAGIGFEELIAQASPDIRRDFGQYVFPGGKSAATEEQYEEARDVYLPELRATMAAYFADHDLDAMIFPATAALASPIGDDVETEVNGKLVPLATALARNIAPGSTAGLPGLVLPAGLSSAGLPVSVELDGPRGTDRALLALGKSIEAVLGPIPPPAL